MAAGLRSLLAWWLGGGGASSGSVAEGPSTLCVGSVRTYPALSATASVRPALSADASVHPALSATTARVVPALSADAFVYPALVAHTVTVGCETPRSIAPARISRAFTEFLMAASTVQTYATRALADVGQVAQDAGLVFVEADEGKDGEPILYFWTGTVFFYIPTAEEE